MSKLKISWTEMTWNPVTGCTKISEGCYNCYAAKMAERLRLMGQPKYANGFNVTIHPESLHDPYKWKKPSMVFVNSMSDLFHPDVPTSFIKQVFDVMNENPQHIFQVLTKRPNRMLSISHLLTWSSNIWMGVSVESDRHYDRIASLRSTSAAIKFLSLEPLLSSLPKLNLQGIDWVIVGGESGFKARPMNAEWVRNIRDLCKKQHVPFFFKQWSGFHPKNKGCLLDGREHKEFPNTVVSIYPESGKRISIDMDNENEHYNNRHHGNRIKVNIRIYPFKKAN